MKRVKNFSFYLIFMRPRPGFLCQLRSYYVYYVIFYSLHLNSQNFRYKFQNFTMDPYVLKWKVIKGIFRLIHWQIIINVRILLCRSHIKEVFWRLYYYWVYMIFIRFFLESVSSECLWRLRLFLYMLQNIIALEYGSQVECVFYEKVKNNINVIFFYEILNSDGFLK